MNLKSIIARIRAFFIPRRRFQIDRLPGVVLIPPPANPEEVEFSPEIASSLRDICDRVILGEEVTTAFKGASRKSRGTAALFIGAPGTGKTLAASWIALRLGRPLYRVDLGLLVSKYIGETEKNLNRVFAAAERADLILFFDEADALFGKRTEVEDAHDRYSNMEISYLLQRIERLKGIAILTTNLRENLDAALMRRMTHVIDLS